MATVRIHFYATLRPIVGGASIELELAEGASVRELVEQLIRRFPGLGEVMLDAEGGLSRRVHVFLDGRGAAHLPLGVETTIAREQRIDIFPAVAGG
jgi:MoaD family protein